jgi:hypothetical protein
MPESIGGYFELELKQSGQFHKGAVALNSGRNCLKYIVRLHNITKVYLPYYICDVVTSALADDGVAIGYYKINEKLEPESLPELRSSSEYLLYINYFGLLSKAVKRLATIYGRQLIIDNSQAFYCRPIKGINTFYSPRKFFGVPDGGFLYTDVEQIDILDRAFSYDRMDHLLKRIDVSPEVGFNDYQENERKLKDQPIKMMSRLTERILGSIDYKWVAYRRRSNFRLLDKYFKKHNKLKLFLGLYDVPMVYPLLLEKEIEIPDLIKDHLYTARYWSSVLDETGIGTMERIMVEKAIFLPIDQRYNSDDMKTIIRRISQL